MTEPVRVEPTDEHNDSLVANVHPPDWPTPEPAGRYNLVVIGAGTAGLVTAAGAAGLGAKVALIERHLLGGDCLNVGCVPSKCLIRSARAVHDVYHAGDYGVRVPQPGQVDFAAVMQRMRRLRSHISHHDSAERFRQLGVDVYLGHARFIGPDAIEVAGKTLRFQKAVIATGARAAHPPVEGLADAGFLSNETVFSLTQRPDRLSVVGGGPLGCELAQAFARFGCQVTVIEMGPQLLGREDPDAARIIAHAFRRDGVNVLLDTRLTRVAASSGQKVLHMEGPHPDKTVTVDEILVAAGRAPNVDGLNLETVGVEYNRQRGVVTDDRLRTTNPRIYAAGDVCLRYKFTHTADAAARIVIQNALFAGCKKLSALTIPWCTYTDPEVAHVGMYQRDAEQQGISTETFTVPLTDVDRAITDGEDEGLLKILVRKGSDRILGATIIARHAGEMISEITLAMVARVGLKTISNVIHPYPTQAEAIRRAADAFNRTRLTPTVKKWLARWLAWTR